MKFPIVSYLTDSTKEFEGEFSLVLFCYGCNFRCSGCYNASFVTNAKNIIGDGYDMLDQLVDPVTTAVVLLGGEPAIHPGFIDVLRKVRSLGLKTKMFTNGYETERIVEALDAGLLDEISVDFKAVYGINGVVGIDMTDEEYLKRLHTIVNAAERNKVPVILHSTMFPSMSHQQAEIISYAHQYFNHAKHVIQPFFDTKDKVQ